MKFISKDIEPVISVLKYRKRGVSCSKARATFVNIDQRQIEYANHRFFLLLLSTLKSS